jgi:membrane-bound ClpP family serine protease
MTWDDWVCVGLFIVGIILFLYGANYYDATVGWTGVLMFVAAFVAAIVLFVYKSLCRRNISASQNP